MSKSVSSSSCRALPGLGRAGQVGKAPSSSQIKNIFFSHSIRKTVLDKLQSNYWRNKINKRGTDGRYHSGGTGGDRKLTGNTKVIILSAYTN